MFRGKGFAKKTQAVGEELPAAPKPKFPIVVDLCIVKQWHAIQKLLDDRDPEVWSALEAEIVSYGVEAVPLLEEAWERSLDELVQSRIEALVRKLHLREAEQALLAWRYGSRDYRALQGLLHRFLFPDIATERMDAKLERMLREVQQALPHGNLQARIRVLNHVVFDVHRLGAQQRKAAGLSLHFVHNLLERGSGSPLALNFLFLMLSERLGLGLQPVALPRHFVLCSPVIGGEGYPEFYVNPYGKGAVFSYRELLQYLKETGHSTGVEQMQAVDAMTFARGALGELMLHAKKMQLDQRLEELSKLHELLLP